ncbi:MAG: hypothetical protein IPK85_03340 [Gemmatimonadetes bacterium]|nr:hypothetical protein [Gemmatimonadota bacterium]
MTTEQGQTHRDRFIIDQAARLQVAIIAKRPIQQCSMSEVAKPIADIACGAVMNAIALADALELEPVTGSAPQPGEGQGREWERECEVYEPMPGMVTVWDTSKDQRLAGSVWVGVAEWVSRPYWFPSPSAARAALAKAPDPRTPIDALRAASGGAWDSPAGEAELREREAERGQPALQSAIQQAMAGIERREWRNAIRDADSAKQMYGSPQPAQQGSGLGSYAQRARNVYEATGHTTEQKWQYFINCVCAEADEEIALLSAASRVQPAKPGSRPGFTFPDDRVRDLLGWCESLRHTLVASNGSVQRVIDLANRLRAARVQPVQTTPTSASGGPSSASSPAYPAPTLTATPVAKSEGVGLGQVGEKPTCPQCGSSGQVVDSFFPEWGSHYCLVCCCWFTPATGTPTEKGASDA